MKNIKNDFSIFTKHPDLVYLDNAATSQTPDCVLKRMETYYTEKRANVHRGLYPLAEAATQEFNQAREVMAKFINAKPEEIIFTSGATDSFNKLITMLEHSDFFRAGDEIVTTVMEHHAVLVPLIELANRKGCVIRYAKLKDDCTLNEEDLRSLVNQKTKLVAMTMASNVLGSMPDVKRICECASEAGALTVVDAAKAAGHIPIDISEIGCDFLFFSGHKMLGPTGIGILYGKQVHLNKFEPGTYGGGAIASVDQNSVSYVKSPEKFEPGTPPIAEAVGLAAAVSYLEKIDYTHQHLTKLVEETINTLSRHKEVKIFAAPAGHNSGVVSFRIANIHPHDVAEVLGRENIAVRAGHHCAEPLMKELGVKSLTRVSFSFYNTTSDVERLGKAIEKTIELFK